MVLPARADLNGSLLDKNSPGPGAVSGSQLFNAIYSIAVSESVYPFCHVMPPKKGLLFIFSAPALPGFFFVCCERSFNEFNKGHFFNGNFEEDVWNAFSTPLINRTTIFSMTKSHSLFHVFPCTCT
jgi:hypothetical protein